MNVHAQPQLTQAEMALIEAFGERQSLLPGDGDVMVRRDNAIEALKGGFADSPILQNHGRRMVEGDFKPGARSTIQLKDTSTAEKLAGSLGLELPVTTVVLGPNPLASSKISRNRVTRVQC